MLRDVGSWKSHNALWRLLKGGIFLQFSSCSVEEERKRWRAVLLVTSGENKKNILSTERRGECRGGTQGPLSRIASVTVGAGTGSDRWDLAAGSNAALLPQLLLDRECVDDGGQMLRGVDQRELLGAAVVPEQGEGFGNWTVDLPSLTSCNFYFTKHLKQ